MKLAAGEGDSAGRLDPRERECLLQDLVSPDDEVRRLAVERLAMLPAEEALVHLAAALGDGSWRVRKAAVECLAASPEDWPVAEHLLRALADGENPGRRNAAVEALVRIGRRVVDPLLAASTSDDVDVRKLVVDALAGIGSERASPRLLALLEDADANVRGAAADALGAIGGPRTVRALLEVGLREGEEALVRFAALRGLARLEAPLTAADLGPALADPLLRPVALGVLGRVADPAGEELLLKGLESGSRATREAAIEGLLRVLSGSGPAEAEALAERVRQAAPPAAVADAIERLGEAELGVRLVLAQFLGVAAAPRAVVPLLRAASADEAVAEVALGAVVAFGDAAEDSIDTHWSGLDVPLRALACGVLGRTRGARGGARLIAALEEADPELTTAAARALAERGDPGALAALVACLARAGEDEPDAEDEREALIDAVVGIARVAPHDEAVGALAACFESASEPVRLAVARVLGEIGSTDHLSLIELLVQDPSPAVRRAAVAALGQVPGEARAEALRLALADEASGVRIAAAAALVGIGPGALDPLERLSFDEDVDVRAAAIRALAELAAETGLAGERVRSLLTSALGDRGPVAIAAVEAFARLAAALSLGPVREVLAHADPEVVQSAVGCLRQHGGAADLAALIPIVAHPHWAVRAGAIEALAERRVVAAVPALLRRLEGEVDDYVRAALLRALQRLEEA